MSRSRWVRSGGRRVVEVLLCEHVRSKKMFIPGSVVEIGQQLPQELVQDVALAVTKMNARATCMHRFFIDARLQDADKHKFNSTYQPILEGGVEIYRVCLFYFGLNHYHTAQP